MSDNLGKNESCISCWIRENPSHCWQKQTHIRIYILSRHAHPEWLTVSTAAEYASFQRWGSITCKQKWGESKGQNHNRQRRGGFSLSIQEMIRGNSEVQNERIRSMEKKRKKRKNVLLHWPQPHFAKYIQTSFWPVRLTEHWCSLFFFFYTNADSSYSLPMINFGKEWKWFLRLSSVQGWKSVSIAEMRNFTRG